mmetsp:Transcript_38806/g.89089  ORF Transcript_38806/g.89089 Transcript_38806/m.89089 type:complete len:285 (-) Transcript_38806:425-1279(-)
MSCWLLSPVMASLLQSESRDATRYSCCVEIFCASSTRTYVLESVRPFKKEKRCRTRCPLLSSRRHSPGEPIMSITSSAGRFNLTRYSSSGMSSGRASHSGRDSMIWVTTPSSSCCSPSCTANVVFPVPGGPRHTTIFTSRSLRQRTYLACVSVMGAKSFLRRSFKLSPAASLPGGAVCHASSMCAVVCLGGDTALRCGTRGAEGELLLGTTPKRAARLRRVSSSSDTMLIGWRVLVGDIALAGRLREGTAFGAVCGETLGAILSSALAAFRFVVRTHTYEPDAS